jgi:hypothetical protein
MRKLAIIILTFAFGVLSVGYGQSAKPDFSGEWKLDKAKSKGLPEGVDQVLTVTQKGDRLEVKTRVSGGPNGEQTHEDSYAVNGEAADFKPPIMGGGATVKKAKRTAKWAQEGKGFDSSEEADVESPEGPATIKATRTWRLSEDGKTLTVEMAVNMPDGNTNKSTRVFTKK